MKKVFNSLKEKIRKKEAKICIIGLGYVGLPLVSAFLEKGFFVYGLDTNISRIRRIRKGISYIVDVDFKHLLSFIKKNKFFPTTKKEVISSSDIIIICVPTPLKKVKIPDISYVIQAASAIKEYLKKGQLIILESTSYPTTTREVVLPILKKSGLEEKDFFLCFSPERVNPADKKFRLENIPKLVGGINKESTDLAKLLYSQIIKEVYPVSTPEVAETAKLLENTFRLVNIALVNEFALLCNKLGIDIWEVIKAAKTKPFGFMSFWPGPGIGGHCLGREEFIVTKNCKGVEFYTLEEFVKEIMKNSIKKRIKGIDFFKPLVSYDILSFDVEEEKVCFKPIELISRRKIKSKLLRIITRDNRKITVSDKHPIFVIEKGKLRVKFAEELQEGEEIPFVLPHFSGEEDKNNLVIDLIEVIKKENKRGELIDKLRVRSNLFSWRAFKKDIYKIKFDTRYYYDYIRNDYLPLKYFLYAEEEKIISVDHRYITLCSGKGVSYTQFPAVITITPQFCRLIGYYLSEGCLTQDKSLRVRFSFNVQEKECIEDICNILKSMKIKYSIYYSKKWKSVHIKISSNLFGLLLRDILKCGENSYEMSIPAIFFTLSTRHKWELLKGIFRGDGGVEIRIGKFRYKKSQKEYYHFCNSAGINYFSSSKKLFQQVIFLLQELGIIPIFKKREGLLYIRGYNQIKKFKNIFLDEKKNRLKRYLFNKRKIISNWGFKKYEGFIGVKIKRIERIEGDYVYSLEVKNTHTLVTSYGTLVHNCIPCDPLYLSWKAKKIGFKTKMIDLASLINRYMPKHVVNRVLKLLGERKITLKKAKILILGVTYKEDVKDLRESPALEIIEEFKKRKIKVDYFDPLVPYLKIGSLNTRRIKFSLSKISKYDCVIIATAHTNIDYERIQEKAKLIFDTRNVYKKKFENVVRL